MAPSPAHIRSTLASVVDQPDELRSLRIVHKALADVNRLRIVQRTDPRGYDYYWFGLGPMVQTPGHSTDLEAIADGYVSVTPLHLDLTHDPSIEPLNARFVENA